MANCVACGTDLRPGAAFCPSCGASVPAPPPACASCGAEIRSGASFCPSCGAVAGATLVPAMPGVPVAVAAGPSLAATPWTPSPSVSRPAQQGVGLVGADWLVIAGALVFVLMDFFYLGLYHYAALWRPGPWRWEHTFATWWWGSYWTTLVHVGSGYGWRWWVEIAGVDLLLHVATVLCVVAAIQALRRGLGGAAVNPGLVRAWGIVAAVATAIYIVWFVLFESYSQIPISEVFQLAGAIAIIVGASRMPVPGPRFAVGGGAWSGGGANSVAAGVPTGVVPRSQSSAMGAAYYAAASQPAAGIPGIGIAGFVLSVLGVSVLGLILSWVGYAQARREERPSGLCLAGIIIGAAGLVVTVVIVVIIMSAAAAVSHSYGE
jgi:hypothetical protein